MALQAAIGAFFVEFSKFDSGTVGEALLALSKDDSLVQTAGRSLDLDARLKLLERMAFSRQVPAPIITDIRGVMSRARKLREHRDEVAANLASTSVSLPAVARVEDYAAEAVALQEALHAVTQTIDSNMSAENPP